MHFPDLVNSAGSADRKAIYVCASGHPGLIQSCREACTQVNKVTVYAKVDGDISCVCDDMKMSASILVSSQAESTKVSSSVTRLTTVAPRRSRLSFSTSLLSTCAASDCGGTLLHKSAWSNFKGVNSIPNTTHSRGQGPACPTPWDLIAQAPQSAQHCSPRIGSW